MCTSFTFTDLANNHFLSRTMDFGFELEANPAFCPRNHQWQSDVDSKTFTGKHAMLGTGREVPNIVFVDGFNEHGLGGAALYLPDEVVYNSATVAGKVNLAPHEVLYWILSNCQSLTEVGEKIRTLNIVDQPISLLGITTPLHWIFSDKSGKTMVVEPVSPELVLIENPVGVMTNTPQLAWHIDNLRNYLHLAPTQKPSVSFGEYTAKPFSQGSGTYGLPGGYTPPERFVRTAFLREHLEKTKDLNQTLSDIFYLLYSVWIPKGIVIKADGDFDYTQYGVALNLSRLTYYFAPYGNHTISSLTLTKDMIENSTDVITYDVPKKQQLSCEINVM